MGRKEDLRPAVEPETLTTNSYSTVASLTKENPANFNINLWG
jgi:hypothetical protein